MLDHRKYRIGLSLKVSVERFCWLSARALEGPADPLEGALELALPVLGQALGQLGPRQFFVFLARRNRCVSQPADDSQVNFRGRNKQAACGHLFGDQWVLGFTELAEYPCTVLMETLQVAIGRKERKQGLIEKRVCRIELRGLGNVGRGVLPPATPGKKFCSDA